MTTPSKDWEYEVVDPFGTWYGKRLIETQHQQPTHDQVRVYLLNETQRFFSQCGPINKDSLGEAILAVPFPFDN